MAPRALLLALVVAAECVALAASLRPVKERELTASEKEAIKAFRETLAHPEPHAPDHSRVEQLSWKPRDLLFHGPSLKGPAIGSPGQIAKLRQLECDFIVNYSRPAMERSTVVGEKGGSTVDEVRTSYGTFLDKYTHPVIKRIEERVAAWTFLPPENQEEMQVLRYEPGQKYGSHHDYYEDDDTDRTGPRYATVLMYLSDVELGGETVFPTSEPLSGEHSCREMLIPSLLPPCSDPHMRGCAVKARKGNALLFFSMNPDASFDSASLHSGCPVIKGEKWSATKWIHSMGFDAPFRDPNLCVDDAPECPNWAAEGECERNPAYMKGRGDSQSELGYCRKSCGVCKA